MKKKLAFVLATIVLLSCNNQDIEFETSKSNTNSQSQFIFTKSMPTPLNCTNQSCYLDGEYWVHNDDEDACTNVSVTIDGFECEGCQLLGYNIVLNTNGADESVGPVNIGNWGKINQTTWQWVNEYFPPLIYSGPQVYDSESDPSTVTQLASGETITFEYWTSYVSDIQFCVYFTYQCGTDEPTSSACCGIVDLVCI